VTNEELEERLRDWIYRAHLAAGEAELLAREMSERIDNQGVNGKLPIAGLVYARARKPRTEIVLKLSFDVAAGEKTDAD